MVKRILDDEFYKFSSIICAIQKQRKAFGLDYGRYAKAHSSNLREMFHIIAKNNFVEYNNGRCSGRGAVRLARLHGVQEVGGSNPLAPTITRTAHGWFFFVAASPIEGC
jgi:hypothetical protein